MTTEEIRVELQRLLPMMIVVRDSLSNTLTENMSTATDNEIMAHLYFHRSVHLVETAIEKLKK